MSIDGDEGGDPREISYDKEDVSATS